MTTRLLIKLLFLAAGAAYAGEKKAYESACGAAKFSVAVRNNGHPLDNTFILSAATPLGLKDLFTSENGGWFHAACLAAKDKRPVLVFQSYCGGSRCLEGKYGVVDTSSLAVLLRPSARNVQNEKAVAAILGSSAPHLGNYRGAFCCGE